MKEEQLSEREKALFGQLARTEEPPSSLEDKTMQRLKAKGLLRISTKTRYLSWMVGIAASVAAFFLGIFYQQQTNYNDMATIESTKGYMLLLHEDQSFQSGDPMEMFNEYARWMENAMEQGVQITGQELNPEATLVTKSGELEKQTEEVTTGFFIVEAESMDEAIKIAKANPHVKYGGTIEVKPYMVR